jgi:hypothetical protein
VIRSRPTATIRRQIAIGPRFAATARTEVAAAVKGPTFRSSIRGNEMTPIVSDSTGPFAFDFDQLESVKVALDWTNRR